MFIDLLKEINEGRAESGRGSKKGREKYTSKDSKKGSVQAKKSRVRIFDTIEAALNSGASYGTIFSTKGADRLYVISKPDWGAKSTAGGNTKIAKGFTPGSSTPGSSWPSIKAHSVRTAIKHGAKKSKSLSSELKKHGPGREKAEGKTRSTVGESYQPISEWDLFVEKVAFLKEQLSGVGKGPEVWGAEPKKPDPEEVLKAATKNMADKDAEREKLKIAKKEADDLAVPGEWTGPEHKAAALRMGKKAAEVGGKGVGLAAKGVVGTAKLGAKGTKLAAKGAVKTTGLAAKHTTIGALKMTGKGIANQSRAALRAKIHGT